MFLKLILQVRSMDLRVQLHTKTERILFLLKQPATIKPGSEDSPGSCQYSEHFSNPEKTSLNLKKVSCHSIPRDTEKYILTCRQSWTKNILHFPLFYIKSPCFPWDHDLPVRRCISQVTVHIFVLQSCFWWTMRRYMHSFPHLNSRACSMAFCMCSLFSPG